MTPEEVAKVKKFIDTFFLMNGVEIIILFLFLKKMDI